MSPLREDATSIPLNVSILEFDLLVKAMLYFTTQSCRLFAAPWTIACQAPLSMGILQVRILEWVAMPSSRGHSQPRDRAQASHIAGGFFTV